MLYVMRSNYLTTGRLCHLRLVKNLTVLAQPNHHLVAALGAHTTIIINEFENSKERVDKKTFNFFEEIINTILCLTYDLIPTTTAKMIQQ